MTNDLARHHLETRLVHDGSFRSEFGLLHFEIQGLNIRFFSEWSCSPFLLLW